MGDKEESAEEKSGWSRGEEPNPVTRQINRALKPAARPGKEPKPVDTFANERTFLAWIRTALGLIIGGLAIIQLLPQFSVPGGRRMIGIPLIVLGAGIAAASYRHWERAERALSLGNPLPRSRMPKLVGYGIALLSLVAGWLAAVNELR